MTLLLIGGTHEAETLAARLGAGGVPVLRRRSPTGRDPEAADEELSDEVRIAELLGRGGVRAVLDMGHPFEAELSARLWRVAVERGLDYLRFLRAPWEPAPSDRWVEVPDEEAAAGVIGDCASVFLATGRESLPAFASLAARGGVLWCRVLSAPGIVFPYPAGGWLPGRPPFSRADERACLRSIEADWLVARNAGGSGNVTKFEAARDLGVRVAMIAQPAPPAGMAVTRDVAEAEAWARR